jgi:arsenate reductase
VQRKMRKQKVLFLCTQNSARSQIAEAFLRHHAGDRFEAYSAGCEAADEIHPYVALVMDEVGIDASEQHPKGLRTYMGKVGFNYSIVVCARAEKNCPKTFPGVGTRLVRAGKKLLPRLLSPAHLPSFGRLRRRERALDHGASQGGKHPRLQLLRGRGVRRSRPL